MGVETKYRYRTPGPGAYDVRTASRQCLKKAPVASFGGSLNKVDRERTGPLKVVGEKKFVPGPCSYAVEADEQARELCDRPHTSIFPRAARDDLSKLFLGKDAVAYIPSRTPGPGTYDLGRKRPSFLSPSCEPGTSIGGPLANVDRVQTGPLGAAYKSYTPGPGAYDYDSGGGEGREDETKRSPARLRQRGRYRRDFSVSVSGTRTGSSINTAVGSMVSESETTDTTRGKVSISLVGDADSQQSSETHLPSGRHEVLADGDGGCFLGDGSRSSFERGGASSRAGARSPFSLSPFRFVGHEEHENWQLPFQVRRPATIPAIKRKNRGSASVGGARSRSPSRSRSNRNSRHSSSSKGSTSRGTAFNSSQSLQSNGGNASWQTQPSTSRPATTFGQGTRAQAGQILAPGFKGNTTRSVAGNPGPGTYRNFPGSLGHQVDSMLSNSPASSFSQSGRLCVSRDAGVPGPGSYARDSSLGCQVSSTRTTAPMPKFGTSVRCALEDGLVG